MASLLRRLLDYLAALLARHINWALRLHDGDLGRPYRLLADRWS